eukprot:CAMPEP_0168592872 /NCGR_PEP_ID=MMETSP0420-20121227/7982_1 /TAXON_ID=498008 /ORGANISM="Pessonella sp." /LENGTH=1441 /DNA_ID=CAMNT_0008628925 /DNA_START=8 /DNA_END=4329 /DNA_ORIENTATION=+
MTKVVVSLADAINLGVPNDAEVYVSLSTGKAKLETRSTRVVNGHTPWPTTDHELNFDGIGVLRMSIYQRNRFTRDVSLGFVRLTRADIVKDMNKFVWRKLKKKNKTTTAEICACVKIVLSPLQPLMMTSSIPSALHAAVIHNDVQEVYRIMEGKDKSWATARDKLGNTALHLAASGSDDVLCALLGNNLIDVNALNDDKNAPLHYFVQNFSLPSYQRVWSMFMSRGAQINVKNKFGEAPLHKACLNPSIRLIMVELLLNESSIDVNSQTTQGETTLNYAIRLHRLDLVELLLKHNASLHSVTVEGQTPLQMASMFPDDPIVTFLKQALEIHSFLSEAGAIEHFGKFIGAELDMELVPRLSNEDLLRIGVNLQGHRLKILRAAGELKSKKIKSKRVSKPTKSLTAEASHDSDRKRLVDTGALTSSDTGTSIEEESFVSAEEIDRFQLDERQLELTRLLHRGRRGVRVYRALYRNSPVAIKFLPRVDVAADRTFINSMKLLNASASPHIAIVVGMLHDPKPALALEFCEHGSLKDVLVDQHALTWPLVLSLLHEAAQGLQFLHALEPRLLHGDLRAESILISRDWHAKLSGAGCLTRLLSDRSDRSLRDGSSTSSWSADVSSSGSDSNRLDGLRMVTVATHSNAKADQFCLLAPEVFVNVRSMTVKSDIFQFAIIMWELINHTLTGVFTRAGADLVTSSSDDSLANPLTSAATNDDSSDKSSVARPNSDSLRAAIKATSTTSGITPSTNSNSHEARVARVLNWGAEALNRAISADNWRPEIHVNCPRPLRRVLTKTWTRAPLERPTADQLVKWLIAAKDMYNEDPSLWDKIRYVASGPMGVLSVSGRRRLILDLSPRSDSSPRFDYRGGSPSPSPLPNTLSHSSSSVSDAVDLRAAGELRHTSSDTTDVVQQRRRSEATAVRSPSPRVFNLALRARPRSSSVAQAHSSMRRSQRGIPRPTSLNFEATTLHQALSSPNMVETNRNIETASRPLHSSCERPSPLTNQAQKVEKRLSLVKQLSGRHVLTLGLAGVPVHAVKPENLPVIAQMSSRRLLSQAWPGSSRQSSRLVDDRQFNATLVADLLDEESSTYSVGSVGSIELDESASKSKNKQSERVKGHKKLRKRSSSRRIADNNDNNPKISVNEVNNGKSDEDATDVENIFDTTVINATTSVEDDNSATSSSDDLRFNEILRRSARRNKSQPIQLLSSSSSENPVLTVSSSPSKRSPRTMKKRRKKRTTSSFALSHSPPLKPSSAPKQLSTFDVNQASTDLIATSLNSQLKRISARSTSPKTPKKLTHSDERMESRTRLLHSDERRKLRSRTNSSPHSRSPLSFSDEADQRAKKNPSLLHLLLSGERKSSSPSPNSDSPRSIKSSSPRSARSGSPRSHHSHSPRTPRAHKHKLPRASSKSSKLEDDGRSPSGSSSVSTSMVADGDDVSTVSRR